MSADPLIGQQLANFRVERLLGRGGMAEVYFGRDVSLQRPVAIKVLNSHFRSDPAYAQQFIQEARSVAAWRHENIVQIHYADQYGDVYYFVMEYLDGLDLGGLLKLFATDDELMQHADVIRIGNAVASALDYAHSKGVIHRDVKPSNVMITTDNRIILTDFGLALSIFGEAISQVAGTPHYMAPEQARASANVVPQSDIYSLGVMLYEMLTGSLPFNDPSPASVALQHVAMEPPSPRDINPRLNPQTEAVLLKALSKKPEVRHRTGSALVSALEDALLTEPESDESDELPPALAAIIAPAISSKTIADKLRLHQQRKATTLNHPDPVSPVSRPAISGPVSRSWVPLAQDKNQQAYGFFAGLLVAGVFIVFGLIAFLILLGDDERDPPVESATTAPPTETASEAVVSQQTPTSPPSTPATLLPTTLPTAINSEPTALAYPDGRRLVFFYDDNSFYIYNASDAHLSLDELTFERLDASNTPTNRMEGWRFAQFAPQRRLNPNWCVEFEIFYAVPYLSPNECVAANSTLRPAQDSPLIFWTTIEGTSQFRVLWNLVEVARCEIGAGQCEAFVP
jgi:serine/threonine protein kinase